MDNEIIDTNSLIVECNSGTLFVPKGKVHLDNGLLVIEECYKKLEYHYRSGSTGMFDNVSYYSRKIEKKLYVNSYSFEIVTDIPEWVVYLVAPTHWNFGKKHNEFKTELDHEKEYKRKENIRQWKSLPWWKRMFVSPGT